MSTWHKIEILLTSVFLEMFNQHVNLEPVPARAPFHLSPARFPPQMISRNSPISWRGCWRDYVIWRGYNRVRITISVYKLLCFQFVIKIMGSEQSSQSARSQRIIKSVGNSLREHQRARSSSPRPSISSDSDIPYISYTVNRPIGDSPKLSSKSPAHSLRASATPSPRSSPKVPRPKSYSGSTSGHDIVVVKEGVSNIESLESDADYIRLLSKPIFSPIMRAALNIPTVQDPEVLDKFDHQAILRLCQRYQEHLRMCAEVVSAEQNTITQRIREIDFAITTLTNMLTERQKKFVKYAEQLSKVQEISSNLEKCQTGLKDVIKNMEVLNNMLPPEERLEPFVMVTG